ncbi:MAG: fatty acid desaturase family protein [Candidatus Rokuibacteriota bacterium]
MTAPAGSRVVPLRDPADWRSLFFLAGLSVLLAGQWTGGLRHWLWLPPACALAFIACVVKHNHVHCRTFRGRAWNAAFGLALSVLTGHPTTAIITAHNIRHHRHNNSDVDWVRCSLVSFRRNWLNLMVFPFASVARMRAEKPSDLAEWRERRPTLHRQALAERVVLYGVLGTLALVDWQATLRALVVPWLFGQWGIVTINLLQHQGCDPASPYDHSRNVTGALVNWFVLNNGFHTAHHLRPSLHWSRLPAFHRRVVEPRIAPGLNHRSLLVATWAQFGPFSRPAATERA